MEKYIPLDQAIHIAKACAIGADNWQDFDYILGKCMESIVPVSLPIVNCSKCKHCDIGYFTDGRTKRPIMHYCNQFHTNVSENFYCGMGKERDEP